MAAIGAYISYHQAGLSATSLQELWGSRDRLEQSMSKINEVSSASDPATAEAMLNAVHNISGMFTENSVGENPVFLVWVVATLTLMVGFIRAVVAARPAGIARLEFAFILSILSIGVVSGIFIWGWNNWPYEVNVQIGFLVFLGPALILVGMFFQDLMLYLDPKERIKYKNSKNRRKNKKERKARLTI